MSTTTEQSRALNTTLQLETDQSTSWLGNLFEVFEAPLDTDGICHQVGELYDWRFLGLSNLKSNIYGVAEVAFFQIYDSRLKKIKDQPLTPNIPTEDSFTPTLTANDPVMNTTTEEIDLSTDDLPKSDHQQADEKKYTLVVSYNTQIFKPSNRQVYYVFPQNALVETVTQAPPYELFCSFYTIDLVQEQQQDKGIVDGAASTISTLNSQPCYTDLMSSSLLLAGTPDMMMEQATGSTSTAHFGALITHLSLSAVSKDLYLIIKETVAGFEAKYGKMIQLMKLHMQAISNRQDELTLVDKNNGTRPRKTTSETKPTKGKRKGSIQQRQTSPRSANATAAATVSNKAKPVTSPKDTNRNAATPKPSSCPPTSSTGVSTPPNAAIPTNTTTSSTAPLPTSNSSSHRHNIANANGRKCAYCGSKTTPMWRRGPEGAGTLCNACGVKWKHGKILCNKPPEQGINTPTTSGSVMGSKATTMNDQHKKRKQRSELDIKKDKRIKLKREQQRQRQLLQNSLYQPTPVNASLSDGMMLVEGDDTGDDDGYTDDVFMEDCQNSDEQEQDEDDEDDDEEEEDDDDMGDEDENEDEDEDERMNNNIVAARHLTIHEDQQHHSYHTMTPLLSPTQPHSRSRSMTTSMVASYISYQQQQQQYQQEHEHQHQQQQYQHDGWSLDLGNQQQSHYLPYHEENQQQHRPRRHTADVSILDRAPWGELPLSMGVDAVEAATVLTLLKRS